LGAETEGTGVQSGTGFIWDGAGNIVTNNHVVAGTSELAVRFASGAVEQSDGGLLGSGQIPPRRNDLRRGRGIHQTENVRLPT
jgi:hypothetical protein